MVRTLMICGLFWSIISIASQPENQNSKPVDSESKTECDKPILVSISEPGCPVARGYRFATHQEANEFIARKQEEMRRKQNGE